jgi:hypothetical protein
MKNSPQLTVEGSLCLMTSFYLLPIIYIAVILGIIIWTILKRKRLHTQIKALANNTLEITPNEFFKIRNFSFGGRGHKHFSTQYRFPGVYILLNKTKNMYYVGQGKSIFDRVNNHFMGKGNGDIYADYKYGDDFTIKMIALQNSGFTTLNELEKSMIAHYDAYKTGYNKTRGNR